MIARRTTPKIVAFLFVITLILFVISQAPEGESRNGNVDSTAAVAHPSFSEMLNNPYAEMGLTRTEYKGKLIFDHYCAVCHGENGDGNGFNSFNLENSFGVRPFNFRDSLAARLSPEEMLQAIRDGGKAIGKSQYMPPWGGTLRPDQILAVINYLQTFRRSNTQN